MAYNFKNALVNLNEEIRKSGGGGGGGDLPAIKLEVSQLKVSMAAVKSSVANVSAEVEAIKQTLASLSPATTEHVIGKWIDGRDIYEKTIVETLNVTGDTSSIDSGLASNSIDKIWIDPGYSYIENSATNFSPMPFVHNNTSNIIGGFLDLTGTNAIFKLRAGNAGTGSKTIALTFRYLKVAPVQKKGGK